MPAITPVILFSAAMGVLAKIVYDNHLGDAWREAMEFSFLPFTALGVAISLFLGFHNNASYGRWWEGELQKIDLLFYCLCVHAAQHLFSAFHSTHHLGDAHYRHAQFSTLCHGDIRGWYRIRVKQ